MSAHKTSRHPIVRLHATVMANDDGRSHREHFPDGSMGLRCHGVDPESGRDAVVLIVSSPSASRLLKYLGAAQVERPTARTIGTP